MKNVETLKWKKQDSISDTEHLLIWCMWARKTTYFVVWALLATYVQYRGQSTALSLMTEWLTNSLATVVLSHLKAQGGTGLQDVWSKDQSTPGPALFVFLHKQPENGESEHMGKQVLKSLLSFRLLINNFTLLSSSVFFFLAFLKHILQHLWQHSMTQSCFSLRGTPPPASNLVSNGNRSCFIYPLCIFFLWKCFRLFLSGIWSHNTTTCSK